MLIIRDALLDDLPGITAIYNEAILRTVATFDTEPKTQDEQKAWFMDHGKRNPIIVADDSGVIAGWAALSKWSDRCAYSDAAEISLYVRKDYQGQGIDLHQAMGFQHIGVMKEVGQKFGRLIDVYLMQKLYGANKH
jgi:phosphinothricin acetyltransferase